MDGSILDPNLDDEVSERLHNYHSRYESDAPTVVKPGYPPSTFTSHGIMKSDAILASILRDLKKPEVVMIPPPNTIGRTLGRMTIEFVKVKPMFTSKQMYVCMGALMALFFGLGMLAEQHLHYLYR